MAIQVCTQVGDVEVYSTGTKWVIDDYQQMHIVGENGNLASYASGEWVSAHHLDLEELPNAA